MAQLKIENLGISLINDTKLNNLTIEESRKKNVKTESGNILHTQPNININNSKENTKREVKKKIERIEKREYPQQPLIMCPYKGRKREIYPSVCQWHREEKDPECRRSNCPRWKIEL